LLWSLRFHNRDGGFYWHWEPAGGGLYKAYHWPGFDSGKAYDERRVLELTRDRAFKIRGQKPPELRAPAAPTLLEIRDPAAISWQGSAGAEDYVVLRRLAQDNATWNVIARHVDDSAAPYRPLYSDTTAEPGKSYMYRVMARRGKWLSPESNVVGPVAVRHRTLVDECRDLSVMAATAGDVRPTTHDDRRRREDFHRVAVAPGGSVIYRVDQPILGWTLTAYCGQENSQLAAAYSTDGKGFEPATVERRDAPSAQGDYGYLHQITLSSHDAPPHALYLRFEAAKVAPAVVEFSHVEIQYGGQPLNGGRPPSP
jgi:hypothetical protein